MNEEKFSNDIGNCLKEEINFHNGWKLKITFGLKNDETSFGHYGKYNGDSRKSVLYDSEGNVISSVIENNPHHNK